MLDILKNIKNIFLALLPIKWFVLRKNLENQLLYTKGKMQSTIFEEYKYCKKVMKKNFNKNLV